MVSSYVPSTLVQSDCEKNSPLNNEVSVTFVPKPTATREEGTKPSTVEVKLGATLTKITRYEGTTQEEFLKLKVAHKSYAKSAKHVVNAKTARKVATSLEAVEEATRTTAQKKSLATTLKSEQVNIEKAFKLYSDMLGNDAKETWEQVLTETCHTERDGPNGIKETPGLSLLTFRECIQGHTLRYIKPEAAMLQKNYMECGLRKHKDINVRQTAHRLIEMNNLIPHMPANPIVEDAAGKKFNVVLSQFELCACLLRMLPQAWVLSYKAIHVNSAPTDLMELVGKLENIENEKKAEERKADAAKAKAKNNGKPSAKFQGKANPGRGGNRQNLGDAIPRKRRTNDKHCPTCKANKRPFWNHNAVDCFHKDKDESGGSAKTSHAMKKLKTSNKEMEKQLKKMSKKLKAMNRDGSSSDSDSD